MKSKILILIILLSGLNNCTPEQDSTNGDDDTNKWVQFQLDTGSETGQNIEAGRFSQEFITSDKKYAIEVSIQPQVWEKREIPSSKASWGTTGGTVTWSPGDAVGIYMRNSSGTTDPNVDRNNVQYTTTSSTNTGALTTTVSPPLYYPSSSTTYADFLAYYPYSWVPQSGETVPSLVQFPTQASTSNLLLNYVIPASQTGTAAVNKADLMYAVARSVNNKASRVNLSFTHALTLLTFQIISTDFSGIILTQATLSGNKVTNTGTLNLNTSQLTPASATFSPNVVINQALNASTPVYTDMIINPCTVNGTSTDMRLTLTIGNMNYVCPIPAQTFVSGTRYAVTVTIRNTQGNNIKIYVGNGGQVQIGQTIIPGGGTGSFNNSGSALSAIITAQPGWIPFVVIPNTGAAPVSLATTSPQTYTIPVNTITNQMQILFAPSAWYPRNGLVIHYDGIYSGGYGITNNNVSANNTWADLSANSHNGTLGNFDYTSSSGWVNQGLSFDGSNDIVIYDPTITSNFTMNFVLSMTGSTQNTNARISGEGPNYPCFVITADKKIAINTTTALVVPVTSVIGSPGYIMTPNKIVQLTMTCTNKIVSLYVDGVYYGQVTVGAAGFPGAPLLSSASLGAAGSILNLIQTSQLKANYYSFMLYNRVLSDTEIQSVYTFNKTRFGM